MTIVHAVDDKRLAGMTPNLAWRRAWCHLPSRAGAEEEKRFSASRLPLLSPVQTVRAEAVLYAMVGAV